MFNQARELMGKQQYALACPKLEESLRLDPAPGTRFNLADCYEHIGRTASAWGAYLEVASAAKRAGLADKEKIARDRAAALEPKLPKLVVEVPGGASVQGLVVRRDGTTVGQPSWGTPTPVDQGEHVVDATAPGKRPFKKIVSITKEGVTETVSVALEDEVHTAGGIEAVKPGAGAAVPAPSAAPPASGASAPEPLSAGAPPPADEKPQEGLGTQRIAGIGIGAAGLVGVVVGAVFGLKAGSKHSEAQKPENCPTPTQCYPSGAALTSDARGAATVSTIAFVAGGVALAGGVVLYFTAPKKAAPPKTGFVALRAGLGRLSMEGAW